MFNIKNKINRLQKKLLYHGYLYHTLNSPIISDTKYDQLMCKLRYLENKYLKKKYMNSPSQKIGSFLLSKLNKSFHLTPMLSLSNVFNASELFKFITTVSKILNIKEQLKFCCEFKIDGLALNLIYRNGVLIKALTRGDGNIGEDVTINAKKMNNIPLILSGKNIPKLIEVRGEVYILLSDFNKLNEQKKITCNQKFSTPRNLAAGSLRQINTRILKNRNLKFICHGYGLIKCKEKKIFSHYDMLKKLQQFGFIISRHNVICNSFKEIISFFNNAQKIRNFLNFAIDGIVIKVDCMQYQKNLGSTSQYPRWAIAYKFISEEKKTKIINVSFQVGRTGVITPVAKLKPIKLSGAIIRKVSLFNKSEFDKHKICIGDKVIVRRSGDVIPYVVKVINFFYFRDNKRVIFPNKCPACNSQIKHSFNNKHSKCINLTCSKKIKLSMFHFFSKQAANVSGLGYKLIDKLVKNGIKNILDIYLLNIEKISLINRMGKISAIKLLEQLESSKNITLSRFIYSLGILSVGINTSKNISKHFISLDNFIHSNEKELLLVKNVGKTVAKNIYKYINDINNVKLINDLIEKAGFIIHSDHNKFIFSHILNNKKIVITGKLTYFSRSKIHSKLVTLGAIITSNVSKFTNLVIVGKKPGINYNRALRLNIEIMKESDLLKIL